jgi:CDP-glucose 4,6-dehydratase
MLKWTPVWNLEVTLEKTAVWYQSWMISEKIVSREQLAEYVAMAVQKDKEWIKISN